MQVGLGHVEFVPASEPVEDRHLSVEENAKSWPGATEKVRVCNADVQLGFGNVGIQCNLRIVLGADIRIPCSLARTLASFGPDPVVGTKPL